jgi:hypothetical protein
VGCLTESPGTRRPDTKAFALGARVTHAPSQSSVRAIRAVVLEAMSQTEVELLHRHRTYVFFATPALCLATSKQGGRPPTESFWDP